MKTHKVLFMLAIGLLPLLAGCPDRKSVITKVNSDGSCDRAVGYFKIDEYDGVDSVIHDLPVPVDSSWKLVPVNDTMAVLTRNFEDIAALNSLYQEDVSALGRARRSVGLNRDFRWFFTVYKYSERYTGIMKDIPMTNYLSEQEFEAFMMDNSEDHPLMAGLDEKAQESLLVNIEERVGYWFHDYLYTLAFDDIVQLGDSAGLLSKERNNLNEIKNVIEQEIDEDEGQLIRFDLDDQMEFSELALMIAEKLSLDSAKSTSLASLVSKAGLDDKYEDELLFGFMEEYDHLVIMPGLVVETNAESIQTDTLFWNISMAKYLDRDYVIYAESRVTNSWAYIVSAVIVVLAFMLPYFAYRRKRQNMKGSY
jgi:hypothetical protein